MLKTLVSTILIGSPLCCLMPPMENDNKDPCEKLSVGGTWISASAFFLCPHSMPQNRHSSWLSMEVHSWPAADIFVLFLWSFWPHLTLYTHIRQLWWISEEPGLEAELTPETNISHLWTPNQSHGPGVIGQLENNQRHQGLSLNRDRGYHLTPKYNYLSSHDQVFNIKVRRWQPNQL